MEVKYEVAQVLKPGGKRRCSRPKQDGQPACRRLAAFAINRWIFKFGHWEREPRHSVYRCPHCVQKLWKEGILHGV